METRKRRNAVEWRAIIAALEQSGAPLKSFAAARGLKAGTVSWWRTQFRLGRVEARAPASKPRPSASAVKARVAFTPVVVAQRTHEPGRVEIVSPCGLVVRVVGDVDKSHLSSVLEAVLQC